MNVHGIALIEAHDAWIERIVLPMDGSAEVWFKHLSVYVESGNERFTIWSYRAVLTLCGIRRVAIDERRMDADYVSDAIVSRGGEELRWRDLLASQVVSRIAIAFGSGRRIEIDCEEAQLVLQEAVREIEEWIGPLVS